MAKIYPSPGVSARPLTKFEAARELYRDWTLRNRWTLRRLYHVLRWRLFEARKFNRLVKALEIGDYTTAPSTMVQGEALQVEDLWPVMENVTFTDESIRLQRPRGQRRVNRNLL